MDGRPPPQSSLKKALVAVAIASLALCAWLIWLPAPHQGKAYPLAAQILINELDSDTPSSPVNDAEEFIELFDGGAGATSLNGLVLVFFNGATDASYRAIDLDGYKTDAGGYLVVGNAAVPGVDVVFPNNTLQNGADAVALFQANASDFPNGTPVTTLNLLDAVVYDTSDADDPGLLVLLNPNQPQVNEDAHGAGAQESIQRCPNGAGSARSTDTFLASLPTPGQPNCVPIAKQAPALVQPGELFTYTITVLNLWGGALTGVVITDALPANLSFAGVQDGGVFSGGVVSWTLPVLADRASAQVRFSAYASQTEGVEIVNSRYAVWASNFPTPTFGIPLVSMVDGPRTLIREIQGAGHLSPFSGQEVERVFGIVTALRSNGFYLQDPLSDADPATSEGIFVFTGVAPSVAVGDALLARGRVQEYRPGGVNSPNLTITELISPTLLIVSSGNPLPEAEVLGAGGRIPPAEVIDDDALGDVETSGVFDPASDGIDFFESLEGMLVQIRDPVAVSPTETDGRIAVILDGGANAGLRSPRGGIVVRAGDFNPERILVDDVILADEPRVNVGAAFNGTLLGVVDYEGGNFRLLNTSPFPSAAGGVISETVTLGRTVDQITVATLNLENLDPADPQSKFDRLAREIVFNLEAPDLIAVEEVQDDSGTVNNGIVSAGQTYARLIQAIQDTGSVAYQYRQIDPLNNQDGGDPGGNIRQAFLFRTDRGLRFVDRPGGDATTPVSLLTGPDGVQLSFSPGRIDPLNSAFSSSRKPLAGEFLFHGRRFFVIANHFNSKQGDQPLFGRYQPPALLTEAKRLQQAQVVNAFVSDLLSLEADAWVIVLGDLNDYPFSAPLQALAGGELDHLVASLPAEEQYTYIFEGNSQALDHILVSPAVSTFSAPIVDIVHLNAEMLPSQRPTDHDSVIAWLTFAEQSQVFLPMVTK